MSSIKDQPKSASTAAWRNFIRLHNAATARCPQSRAHSCGASLSPEHVAGIDKTVIRGRPDPEKISTSYVEGFNLSSRIQMRRSTRLPNGFSKRLESHEAAVALWICFYNLCRIHESLRWTPAMALGVTNHIWGIGELVQAALEPQDLPPLPTGAKTTLRPGTRRFRLIVGRGGKGTNKPR